MNTLLLIPVTLWLLLPPGICVCHGLGNLLPFLGSETIRTDAPVCEDTEHAPWCPCHKMTYHHTPGENVADPPDAGLVAVLPLVMLDACSPIEAVTLSAPPLHPADSPLYLNLCALRI